MLQYTKREVTYGTGGKHLVARFDNPKYTILSAFLETEVDLYYEDVIKCFDAVLVHGEVTHEFRGTSCLMHVARDKTLVACDIDCADIGAPCYIETNELRELVESWHKELEAFRKSQSDQQKK